MPLIDPRPPASIGRRSALILASNALATLAAPSIITGNAKAGDLEHVERHVVFIVDVSNSVDDREHALMMSGFADALVSEEATAYFGGGAGYALSTVFFASQAMHGATRIIRNPHQAKQFAQEEFFNPETNLIRPRPSHLGQATNILSAMEMMEGLLGNEQEYGFETMHRAVILAGDGENNQGNVDISHISRRISSSLNTVIYGIPILEPQAANGSDASGNNQRLIDYFRDVIATPEGLRCSCQGLNLPVRPGQVFPADDFQQLQPAVLAALRGIQL